MGTDLNFALQQLSPALDGLMRALSFLGTEDFFMLLIPFIFWCLDSGFGARLLFLLITSDYINGILKLAFHAPRPYWMDTRLRPIATETSYGLPSNHAQSSLTTWGYLAVKINRWWLWLLTVLIIFGVSLSRLYLGEHFLGDVIVGLVVGLLILLAFITLEPRVTHWIAPRSIGFQITAAFMASLSMIVLMLIVRALIGNVLDPSAWAAYTGPIGPRNLDSLISDAAIVFGAGAGLALLKRTTVFDARGPWSKRLGRLALGLIVLLALRFGLSAIFPHDSDVLGGIFRYLRYVLMLLWAVWLAPWTFVKLRLA